MCYFLKMIFCFVTRKCLFFSEVFIVYHLERRERMAEGGISETAIESCLRSTIHLKPSELQEHDIQLKAPEQASKCQLQV